MLRACVAQGWPLRYTDADHPLQREIREEVAASAGESPDPMGVDGCGVPTFSGTVAGLARAFARLATDPALAPVADAMARFAAITADGDRAEAELARWCHAAVKAGAQGCIGVAWFGGLGVAAKCWSGQDAPAMVAIVAVLRHLGILPDYPAAMLAEVARPAVLGRGRPVGSPAGAGRPRVSAVGGRLGLAPGSAFPRPPTWSARFPGAPSSRPGGGTGDAGERAAPVFARPRCWRPGAPPAGVSSSWGRPT